jgi:hypothetical protein
MYERVDFRKNGLKPFSAYIISNTQTGELYGTFRVGPLGAIKNIEGTNQSKTIMVRYIAKNNPKVLSYKEVK